MSTDNADRKANPDSPGEVFSGFSSSGGSSLSLFLEKTIPPKLHFQQDPKLPSFNSPITAYTLAFYYYFCH